MKILVDTSVWADFFNGHPSAEAAVLAAWIREGADIATCGLILAEVLQGLRSDQSVADIRAALGGMCWLTPQEPATYLDAASLFRKLRQRGVTVRSTIDCLLVCLAEQNGAFILAKDRDIRQILESGLTSARAVPTLH